MSDELRPNEIRGRGAADDTEGHMPRSYGPSPSVPDDDTEEPGESQADQPPDEDTEGHRGRA